jgi:hypothetical protein
MAIISDVAQEARLKFHTVLTDQYKQLFETEPEYAYVAEINLPMDLARKMMNSLSEGAGNKDGKGIVRTCKALGIKHTYKAIKQYLNEGWL